MSAQECFKPLYTTIESVKLRLVNKVQFQEDPQTVQQGELPNDLLGQLIADAETAVEQDLRGRYMIPFQSIRTGRYADLPDHSKRALRRLVDFKCVMEVLTTDFGRGGNVDGETYFKNAKREYDAYLLKLMGRDVEAANDKRDRFRFTPPLEDVRLSTANSKADDGYKGMLINTDASRNDVATYAGEQINNPAQSYINRRIQNPAGG